jgi:hypothetical protein
MSTCDATQGVSLSGSNTASVEIVLPETRSITAYGNEANKKQVKARYSLQVVCLYNFNGIFKIP